MSALETDQVLAISHTFRGTPERIYRAWTEPELLSRWSCPAGCRLVECASDPIVGGRWSSAFETPEGGVHRQSGTWLELVPFRRLSQSLENFDGFVAGEWVRTVIDVTLTDLGEGTTRLEFVQTGIPGAELREGIRAGTLTCFEQLAAFLTDPVLAAIDGAKAQSAGISEQTLSITRTFQSTPDMLYRAWTQGPLLQAWGCPADCEMIDYQTDPKVGGGWHKRHRNPDGSVHEETGEYLELDPPRRIVQTLQNVNGFVPGRTIALQITIEFAELGPDRTEMRFVQSGGMTEGMHRGMDIGWNSCFDKLQVEIAN